MGRKKRKYREEDEVQGFNNNPFGIDPNQLMAMLGGGNINNILNSMNQNGVNLGENNYGNNNQNYGGNNKDNLNPMTILQGLMNNSNNNSNFSNNMNNRNEINNTSNINNKSNNISNSKIIEDPIINNNKLDKDEIDRIERSKIKAEKLMNKEKEISDENIEMLIVLKKIVNNDRRKFIDKIINLYYEGIFDEKDKKNE